MFTVDRNTASTRLAMVLATEQVRFTRIASQSSGLKILSKFDYQKCALALDGNTASTRLASGACTLENTHIPFPWS